MAEVKEIESFEIGDIVTYVSFGKKKQAAILKFKPNGKVQLDTCRDLCKNVVVKLTRIKLVRDKPFVKPAFKTGDTSNNMQ